MAFVVDDLEDVNEHLLGLALVRTMRAPGNGAHFEEVAVALVEAIKREGWIPCEDRNHAEQELRKAEVQLADLTEAHKEQEDELLKLRKQVAVLVAQLSGVAVTPTPGITPYPSSPSTPWVTYTTSTSTAALPAAEVAAQILRRQRRAS